MKIYIIFLIHMLFISSSFGENNSRYYSFNNKLVVPLILIDDEYYSANFQVISPSLLRLIDADQSLSKERDYLNEAIYSNESKVLNIPRVYFEQEFYNLTLSHQQGNDFVPSALYKTESKHTFFIGDFEHGIMPLTSENENTPWNNSGNPPEVVSKPEPVRFGRYSMKSFLDRNDSTINYRTEVSVVHDSIKIRKDYWYGFSLFFPESWTEDSVWEVILQWHALPDFEINEDWRNPPLSFNSDGINLSIRNRWDSQEHTQNADLLRGTQYEGDEDIWKGAINKNQWDDWVFHINWSYLEDGYIIAWRNGIKVLDKKGPVTFNDKKAPYFKMGVYKGWRDLSPSKGIVQQRTMYHDEVRFADTNGSYNDVAPPGPRNN